MKINPPKVEELKVIINASRKLPLTDRRSRTSGIYFGTIEEIAKNLGVILEDINGGLMATAPKLRLQLFVEKLHFSGIPYRAI